MNQKSLSPWTPGLLELFFTLWKAFDSAPGSVFQSFFQHTCCRNQQNWHKSVLPQIDLYKRYSLWAVRVPAALDTLWFAPLAQLKGKNFPLFPPNAMMNFAWKTVGLTTLLPRVFCLSAGCMWHRQASHHQHAPIWHGGIRSAGKNSGFSHWPLHWDCQERSKKSAKIFRTLASFMGKLDRF